MANRHVPSSPIYHGTLIEWHALRYATRANEQPDGHAAAAMEREYPDRGIGLVGRAEDTIGCCERAKFRGGEMADRLTAERRSALMRSVRQRDTAPELVVRRTLHSLGYRFRLHRKDLPGTPDIVLPRYKLAIFVHGCFWHRHQGCRLATMPASNVEFWVPKFEGNVARDVRKEAALRELGWQVLTVWQCETKDVASLAARLRALVG